MGRRLPASLKRACKMCGGRRDVAPASIPWFLQRTPEEQFRLLSNLCLVCAETVSEEASVTGVQLEVAELVCALAALQRARTGRGARKRRVSRASALYERLAAQLLHIAALSASRVDPWSDNRLWADMQGTHDIETYTSVFRHYRKTWGIKNKITLNSMSDFSSESAFGRRSARRESLARMADYASEHPGLLRHATPKWAARALFGRGVQTNEWFSIPLESRLWLRKYDWPRGYWA